MKDLKNLAYFENLIRLNNNDLVAEAKKKGQICVAYVCENTPEPLFDLDNCFGIRLTAPNTEATEIASYYMTNFLCETSRALLERAIEGGYNFADCIIAPDGCTMINRCVENMELANALGKDNDKFFYEHMEIPLKADDNGVELLVLQCKNHILKPLHEKYGVDVSDTAIRKSVEEYNRVCKVIRQLGDFRKEKHPRITGYEFQVLTLASYVCPKRLIIDKLEEILEEVKQRKPDDKDYRARLLVVGSEMDDVNFIKLIEDAGAYVCADRYCFGSHPGRDLIELKDDEDALTQVCRQYVYRGQCPRLMNQEKVYSRKAYVANLAKEYNAEGIIYNQIKFCDPWAYERLSGSTALRQDYGYPVLSIDRPYNSRSAMGQISTRVQAFIESIEIKNLDSSKGKEKEN